MRFPKQLTRFPKQLTRFLKELTRFLKQLMRFPEQLTRFPKQLMRFLKELMRFPEQLTRFLKQLMRFLKQLMRFSKVSTGFPEVAMHSPIVWRIEPKRGGRAWFVSAGSLLVFNLWVGWRCAQRSRLPLRLIHPGGWLRAIILLGGGCSGCAVEADWCA